jgi:hypothetical protein
LSAIAVQCFAKRSAADAKGADALQARCTMHVMQLTTGTVIGGKIVIDGEPLPEGAVVTVLAREDGETFIVPPELEADLDAAIAEAQRGELIPGDEVLRALRGEA